MTLWSSSSPRHLSLLLLLLTLLRHHPNSTSISTRILRSPSVFREAPSFGNPNTCDSMKVNIVMTLDSNYLRGTMAAVLSILQHSTCPENNNFHFLSLHITPKLASTIHSTFPYLNFKIYRFDPNLVHGKISKSLRLDLDQPLNYARIYLSNILPNDITRVIYLDSDIIVVDDIAKLWAVDLGDRVIAAPEYCQANFTYYFTDSFWSDPDLASTFRGREACYFNTGVMVVDLEKWRKGEYINKVEKWMLVQKMQKRIYHLGSLPPFLLVFGGYITAIDHRWNLHGLGGDNFEGKCRGLHPGPISLLHWSGKGKPWLRLDSRRPCIIDHLWAPYDLYRSSAVRLEE